MRSAAVSVAAFVALMAIALVGAVPSTSHRSRSTSSTISTSNSMDYSNISWPTAEQITPTTSTTTPAPVQSTQPEARVSGGPIPTPAVSSDGTDVLSTMPAYVQQAFACIAQIESNGEPGVVNASSGDGGLFQFNPGTWLAHGGGQFAPRAELASVAQQDTVAAWTWQSDGFGPWAGDERCWQ